MRGLRTQEGSDFENFFKIVQKEAKRLGARSIAITNSIGSSIAREADYTIYTLAGPEIAVASTKAYTTQLVAIL